MQPGGYIMKEVRYNEILKTLESQEVVKVIDLASQLNVTDMTIRRDLQELEEDGLLIRTHGGARSIPSPLTDEQELSHMIKKKVNPAEKQYIARIIAKNIKENDTVFLGSGSTIELVYDYLTVNHAKIITNSIYVFEKFKHDDRFELLMTGGSYRPKTGSFIGTIAKEFISTINVRKAFIGVNGINNHSVFNANEEEGVIQKSILNNSHQKFIVADYTKFNKADFYNFYDLRDIDYLITDNKITEEDYKTYSEWVTIRNY